MTRFHDAFSGPVFRARFQGPFSGPRAYSPVCFSNYTIEPVNQI